jgi:hypothetical protein
MNEDRINEFTAEIAGLKTGAAKGDRERWGLILGVVLLFGGLVAAIVGGFQASGAEDAGDQWAFIATGSLIGLACVLVGVALFVRYSMAKFLRFWLVRLIHEHRTETDRLIAAINTRNNDSIDTTV